MGAELDLDTVVVPGADVEPAADDLALVVAAHGRDELTALRRGLEAGLPYVGLVASRVRGSAVVAELHAEGVTEERLAQLETPAGLDIGARTPEEIALSILARIVAVRRGEQTLSVRVVDAGSGRRTRARDGDRPRLRHGRRGRRPDAPRRPRGPADLLLLRRLPFHLDTLACPAVGSVAVATRSRRRCTLGTTASAGWPSGSRWGSCVILVAAAIVIAIVLLAHADRQAGRDGRARPSRCCAQQTDGLDGVGADQRLRRADPARGPRPAQGGGRQMTSSRLRHTYWVIALVDRPRRRRWSSRCCWPLLVKTVAQHRALGRRPAGGRGQGRRRTRPTSRSSRRPRRCWA